MLVNCLWVGTSLRQIEIACLLSMLRAGHDVRLFSYGPILNVPDGCEVADANELIPQESFLFYRKTNSPSLGANVFRYKVMEQGLGLWLDLDVLVLKPIPVPTDYLFGLQDLTTVNGAVFYLPQNSILLERLLNYVKDPFVVPPFFRISERAKLHARKLLGIPWHVSDLSWGVFGPRAITYFAKKLRLLDKACPPEVFYPVHEDQAHGPFCSGFDVEKLTTPNTLTIHLWNEKLRQPSALRPENPRDTLIIEEGCFFERFCRNELNLRVVTNA